MSENDILATKKQVRKAGENIRNNIADDNDYKIIASWRSIHNPIMTNMVNAINRKLNSNNLKAVLVARRLKRLSSIELKLKRFKDMQLDRMQDIAGVRVVFKNLEQVTIFQQLMEKTYLRGSRKFKLLNEKTKDYIQNPKDDGYRSIHQIFEYKDVSKRCLELQIRTQLQHYWATAVEVLGMKTQAKIKQGEGEQHYKVFLKLCSALFCIQENTPIMEEYKNFDKREICKRILELDKEYNILKQLSGLAVSSKNIENQAKLKQNYYFIVLLDLNRRTLTIRGYKKNDFQTAEDYYNLLEQQSKQNGNTDVVLISLDKLKLLKRAYPNYYLDSRSFIKELSNHLKNCGDE